MTPAAETTSHTSVRVEILVRVMGNEPVSIGTCDLPINLKMQPVSGSTINVSMEPGELRESLAEMLRDGASQLDASRSAA